MHDVKDVHLCLRDIACPEADCDRMFSQKANMKTHYESFHTKEGMQRKCKKQDRVRQVLESMYAVDSECHIRYAYGCVPDPDRFCSRLDFHIVGITSAIVIVECDENGHRDYELSCELTRMEQTHESILKAQYADMVKAMGEETALLAPQLPVVFVRFNPDAHTVDGVSIRNDRKQKEVELLKVLHDIDKGDIELPHILNIVYVGYDLIDGEPAVLSDPDFSEQMRTGVILL